MVTRAMALAVSVVLLAGCSSSDSAGTAERPASNYRDASALATSLDDVAGCTNRETVDPLGDSPADGVDYPLPSALRCNMANGQPAYLFVYDTDADRREAADDGMVESAGYCDVFDVDVATGLFGANWRIVLAERQDVLDLRTKMGEGNLERASCVWRM